jgi:hypothetical protein
LLERADRVIEEVMSAALTKRDAAGSGRGGDAMKMNGTAMRIGVTVLALGVSLLSIPTSRRKGLPGYRASAGWRFVAPVLGAPISIFSGLG